jgi:Tol biopolymer transport system component/DNA-binding winged helix-turn-helix (wHTH) protein
MYNIGMKQKESSNINKHYHFGDWQFSPADGQLISQEKSKRLQPRLAKLLLIFVDNCDVLLTRDDLIEALWKEKSVNEDALSRCVAELRSALGDKRSEPIYIETVPKKGYRFIHQLSNAQPATLENSNILALKKLVLITVLLLLLTSIAFYFTNSNSSGFDENTQLIRNALVSAKRVTTDTSIEQQPELSNQGDKIAFSVIEEERMIVKIISDAGELLHLLKDPKRNLLSATFSPDDSSLLVAASGSGQCTIYQYKLPSLTRKEIVPCSFPNLSPILDWSPLGDSFVYVAKSKSIDKSSYPTKEAIWSYNLTSTQSRQLTFPSDRNAFDTRPQYSPNGEKLAFTRGTSSQRNIHLLDLKTHQPPVKLNHGKGFISSFNWLHDSTHIIFDSNEIGDKYLWLLNSVSKEQSLLGAMDARYPSVNKNNEKVAFQKASYNANIWQVNLAKMSQADKSDLIEQTPNKIIESIKYNNFPTYSPDGKTIAFVSNREGKAAIWTYSTESNQQKKLLAIPNVDLVIPNWAPDGKNILVSSRGPEGYRCYQVSLDTGLFQPLYSIQQQHHECHYSGQGVIYAVLKEPSATSKLISISTQGKIEILTDFSVERVVPTAFGTLVYSLPSKSGIFSMDLDGGNKQVVKSDYDSQLSGHWTVQGDHLYYPRVKQDIGIWKLNLKTGNEIKVSNIVPTAIGYTLNVSPDHQQLIYVQTDNRQADIYLTKTNND